MRARVLPRSRDKEWVLRVLRRRDRAGLAHLLGVLSELEEAVSVLWLDG
jgi:hypothetical protein